MIGPPREHHELVAAKPKQAVGGSQRAGNLGSHRLQNGVPLGSAEPDVDRGDAVHIDQHQRHGLIALQAVAQHHGALSLHAAAIEQSGQLVAAAARWIRDAFAKRQVIEDIPNRAMGDGRRMAPDTGLVQGEQQRVDEDGKQFAHPAAPEGPQRNACDIVQGRKKADLVECQQDKARYHETQHDPALDEAAEFLVEQDDADRIDIEQRRAPDHQPAHLLKECEIRAADGRPRGRYLKLHEPGDANGDDVAEKQPVNRLADRCRIFLHIQHQDHHQLAGKQDG